MHGYDGLEPETAKGRARQHRPERQRTFRQRWFRRV